MRHSENREDIGFQLVMVSRRYRKAMDAVFAENDLSDATSLPLRYLARQETPLRQKDLADRLAIEGPTLVRTLDMLVSKGLVRRTEDPDDRRAKLISATDEGRACLKQISTRFSALRSALFDGIAEADIDATLRLLDQLERNIATHRDR
ncbi:MarR family winged helix-turn-helix transcriptional regulator [Donghicola eburneus]|uniref:MarR family transcriptional regulator n=1 Tax=Donghicola eburneus TaxID=393278 RepID=A0A1M4N0C9_9RHOB|nr:MarR family transcriptional regulator [Donghicola eburneus]SCM68261.1 MarR family transcriptional regulator [Donghicola eburneus]SFQ20480.1 transcriptional regulator, MarR family [Donghicola eburneus]